MHEGKPVLSSLSNQNMNRAAQAGGGIYRTITLDEEDVRDVIGATSRLPDVSDAEPQAETKADTWKDFGSVLCILILPFAAFGYRRGWLGGLMLFIVFSSSPALCLAAVRFVDAARPPGSRTHYCRGKTAGSSCF